METNGEVDKDMFISLFEHDNDEKSKYNSMYNGEFTDHLKKFKLHMVQEQTFNDRTLLQHYAELGSVEHVRSVLELGINPNVISPNERKTAIHVAAENNPLG